MRSPSRKGKEKAHDCQHERVIMHCDFDAFFVSAGLLDRKHLRGKPVVVCHSQDDQGGALSTSEIASASYEAREFGIKNGMRYSDPPRLARSYLTSPLSVYSRLESCAQQYKPYHTSLTSVSFVAGFKIDADIDSRYRNLSLKFYTILMSCADDLEAVSVDEALIDVTSTFERVEPSQRRESIRAYAESIRTKVREETSCEGLSLITSTSGF